MKTNVNRALLMLLLAAAVSDCAAQAWTASWGAALMAPSAKTTLAPLDGTGATLRQAMRLSLGGAALRVRISNRWGATPLVIGAASVGRLARPGAADLAGAPSPLRFGGRPDVTVAPGMELVSDPLPLATTADELVAVSLYVTALPAVQSAHLAAHATQFLAAGNAVMRTTLDGAAPLATWYQVEGIEVQATAPAGLLVAIGDSITDGTGSGQDRDERWPDYLRRRLPTFAVVDAGIGGNRMLADGNGPGLAARFAHDVLARPGVTHALVLIGVNDLGRLHHSDHETPQTRAALLTALEAGWDQLAAQAHARGVCFIAGTLTPYGASRSYRPAPDNEADRQRLNTWLRTHPGFDGVVDFDAAVRDPQAPAQLLARYDSGDGLHPSPAGYAAMAAAVPLETVTSCGPRAPVVSDTAR